MATSDSWVPKPRPTESRPVSLAGMRADALRDRDRARGQTSASYVDLVVTAYHPTAGESLRISGTLGLRVSTRPAGSGLHLEGVTDLSDLRGIGLVKGIRYGFADWETRLEIFPPFPATHVISGLAPILVRSGSSGAVASIDLSTIIERDGGITLQEAVLRSIRPA